MKQICSQQTETDKLMSEKKKQRKVFLVKDRECFALSHFLFTNQN